MEYLTDLDSGTFTVDTASGTRYQMDLDARTALRIPRTSEPAATNDPADLRKDGETVYLVKIIVCEVGALLTLLLDDVDTYDGYSGTLRRATTVLNIERIS